MILWKIHQAGWARQVVFQAAGNQGWDSS